MYKHSMNKLYFTWTHYGATNLSLKNSVNSNQHGDVDPQNDVGKHLHKRHAGNGAWVERNLCAQIYYTAVNNKNRTFRDDSGKRRGGESNCNWDAILSKLNVQ